MELQASLVQSKFSREYINKSTTHTLLLECGIHVWLKDKAEAFRSLESSIASRHCGEYQAGRWKTLSKTKIENKNSY